MTRNRSEKLRYFADHANGASKGPPPCVKVIILETCDNVRLESCVSVKLNSLNMIAVMFNNCDTHRENLLNENKRWKQLPLDQLTRRGIVSTNMMIDDGCGSDLASEQVLSQCTAIYFHSNYFHVFDKSQSTSRNQLSLIRSSYDSLWDIISAKTLKRLLPSFFLLLFLGAKGAHNSACQFSKVGLRF